jgi:hypothetical protein
MTSVAPADSSAVVPIALINPSLTATASAPAGIFALGEIIFALVKTFIWYPPVILVL